MFERAWDRRHWKVFWLESVALKKRITAQAAYLKFVRFVASEPPLQLLEELRLVLGGLDVIRDLIELSTKGFVCPAQEFVSHDGVDGRAKNGKDSR
jgi:hypothetical protein